MGEAIIMLFILFYPVTNDLIRLVPRPVCVTRIDTLSWPTQVTPATVITEYRGASPCFERSPCGKI